METTPEAGFRADIQALRALAVSAVLAFHIGLPGTAGGFVGVDVFFVISGYLITQLMMRDAQSDSPGTLLVEFYARRLRRILPAATVVIVATVALCFITTNGVDIARAITDARAAALFFANAHFVGTSGYFGSPNGQSVFQQFWSLAVEEQFYAIWPLLFVAALAVSRSVGRDIVKPLVVTICAASFALCVAWTFDNAWPSDSPTKAFYLLPPRAWELGVGVLLALFSSHLQNLSSRVRLFLQIFGLGGVVVSIVAFTEHAFPGFVALVPTLGTAAVLAAGINNSAVVGLDRVWGWPVLQLLGRYSYSLYLWHWPVQLLVVPEFPSTGLKRSIAAHVLVTLPMSVATYHFVENPVRRARLLHAVPARSLAFGAAVLVVSVGTLTAATGVNQSNLETSRQVARAAVITPTNFVPVNLEPSLDRAAAKGYHGRSFAPDLTLRADRGAGRVALFGDSHAEHLIPAFDAASAISGLGFRAMTMPACPWFELVDDGVADGACSPFIRSSVEKLRADPPDLIVVSARNDRPGTGSVAEWSASVGRGLTELESIAPVLVISETPAAKENVAECAATNLHDTTGCDMDWPEERNALLHDLTVANGAEFLDLREALCTSERCPAISGNQLIWRDRDHLTAEFSESLGAWIAERVKQLIS